MQTPCCAFDRLKKIKYELKQGFLKLKKFVKSYFNKKVS